MLENLQTPQTPQTSQNDLEIQKNMNNNHNNVNKSCFQKRWICGIIVIVCCVLSITGFFIILGVTKI
jgi:hypothetical protein